MPGRRSGWWMLAAVLAIAPGCSTTQIDTIPHEIGGLPQGAPARPAEQPAFPAVHDMPSARAASLLDAEQQQKLEADLIALRNRQPGQEKNRAKEAKKQADKKAKEQAKSAGPKKKKVRGQPQQQVQGAGRPGGQAVSGAPPWPLPPPQTPGGSPRP